MHMYKRAVLYLARKKGKAALLFQNHHGTGLRRAAGGGRGPLLRRHGD